MEWFTVTDTAFKLLQRHQQLDEQIRDEQKRRWPDVFRLQRLKKLKLAIRDRIGRIMRTRQQALAR